MSVETVPTDVARYTGVWAIDPAHSRIGFAAKHAMVTTVRGNFTDFSGEVTVDGQDPTRASVKVEIQVASVTTGNEQRDGHLRSGDFFELDEFPTITFAVDGVALPASDPTEFDLPGELTIKGVTRPVTLKVEHTGLHRGMAGDLRAGFEARTTVNRRDWGLNWNVALDAGGILVSEKVKIEIDVALVHQS